MNHTGLEFRSSILQNSLSCFSPKIHLQDLWKRFQFVLDHNLGHFEANLFDRAEIVMEAGKYIAFQVRLNSRSEPRTKLVAKTPNPQILARVSLCWPPMSVCGKNVYALRACKRSNRDFLRLYTGNTYTFSLIQSSSITRRVLRCLLGFLALWGQKPCGGNYYFFITSFINSISSIYCWYNLCQMVLLAQMKLLSLKTQQRFSVFGIYKASLYMSSYIYGYPQNYLSLEFNNWWQF